MSTTFEAISAQQTMTTTSERVRSIDFVRGLVMILMAIDHVRVYSGLPAGGPEVGIFFTRWVTHFCAPVFVFLSGTSAYLYGKKVPTSTLSKYLLVRGFILIALEFTLIRFAWTFNFNYSEFFLAGVIWMLGASMVVMAGLVYLRPAVVGIAGLAIMFLQNLFGFIPQLFSDSTRNGIGRYWEFIYTSGLEAPDGITILYVLVPWIGVMAAGYGFGKILDLQPARRKKLLIGIGAGATILFALVATLFVMSNDGQDEMPFVMQVLNQRKYPASQLYLLMTLGPAIFLMAFTERKGGQLSQGISTIGKVPFFYYLLHIPLIHLTALGVNLLREGRTLSEWYTTAPFVWFPEEGHQWSLPLLYAVFAVDLVILFIACRWYERYKFSHPDVRWLKYL